MLRRPLGTVNRSKAARHPVVGFALKTRPAERRLAMSVEIALGIGFATGGAIVFLLAWSLRAIARRRARRNLASAFIGEIVAALREIELSGVEAALDSALSRAEGGKYFDIPELVLPHFSIYEADAGKLDWFAAPLPRKIAYVVERLESLPHDLSVLKRETVAAHGSRKDKVRLVQDDLTNVLAMADDALRGLRRYVSQRRVPSIVRA